MSYSKTDIMKQFEPIRFYWDGKELHGIYPGDSKYKKKPHKRRYLKGSVEYTENDKKTVFVSYSSSISPEKAWDLYPEYFI